MLLNPLGVTVVFADQDVGLDIVRFMLDSHASHLRFVVTMSDNEIADFARSRGCQVVQYEELIDGDHDELLAGVQAIFLAWWPKIVPRRIFSKATIGAINLHPSLLPCNRGKNYNFWTIVEESPFGVSMHLVDDGIDTGDILFQTTIEKTWEDSGASLYLKAKQAVVDLFRSKYEDVLRGKFERIPQAAGVGSFHLASELEPASRIFLEREYRARDLLNLLRARTFEGKPACHFLDGDRKYEVRISIIEVTHGSR